MTDQNVIDLVAKLRIKTQKMPNIWDGKSAILEMKDGGSTQWKQIEWIGFYFEFLCETHFADIIEVPGSKYGNTEFDAFQLLSWDFKVHATNSKSARNIVIANDINAMIATMNDFGYYGLIIALGVAEYNDEKRTFKKWHDEIKGGVSKYQIDRRKRGAKSKLRKTRFVLSEIRFICLNSEALDQCSSVYNQGRNSDGKPRPPKYKVNIKKIPEAALIATQLF